MSEGTEDAGNVSPALKFTVTDSEPKIDQGICEALGVFLTRRIGEAVPQVETVDAAVRARQQSRTSITLGPRPALAILCASRSNVDRRHHDARRRDNGLCRACSALVLIRLAFANYADGINSKKRPKHCQLPSKLVASRFERADARGANGR
jgi:hypothetical protein